MDKKMTPQQKYHLTHQKNVTLSFIVPNEQDLYDKLQAQKNKNGYIKSLIRKDIAEEKNK